jgi:large repetitive protein
MGLPGPPGAASPAVISRASLNLISFRGPNTSENMRSKILVGLLLCLSAGSLRAEHLPGGSITYTCLGNNMFEVRLTLLRECSGFPMVGQQLRFTNDCGVEFNQNNLQSSLVESAGQLCVDEAGNGSCSGGALVDFERHHFVSTLYLSPCNSWTVAWSICCRPATLNVQANPGLYIETRINNAGGSCDSSPVFNDNDVPHACVGQPVNYDGGATDVEGNHLVYSLIDARYASPFPVSVNYVFPNFGGQPVAGMAINPATGFITFTPTTQGLIVVVVKVDEYNANNQWIGSVMRDFPFRVTACSNTLPSAGSGMITGTSGGAMADGERSMELCRENASCALIEFSDPDASQALTISTNVASVLPGVTITYSGTNPVVATLCWTELNAAVGNYTFTMTATDNACPIMGTRSYLFTAEVVELPYAGMSSNATACVLTTPFALLDSLAGDPPAGGSWTNPQGNPHSGIFDNIVDGPGTYTYTITVGHCSASANLVLTFIPENEPSCIITSMETSTPVGFSVRPNPTAGELVLEGLVPGAPLALLDMNGRSLWMATFRSDATVRFALPEHLANGLYLLRTLDAQGIPLSRPVLIQR